VAKGRVWSGEQAKENGLVDALGGYGTALQLARDAARIAADQPFTLTVFPREKGTVELIYAHLFGAGEREEGASATLARGITALRAAAGALEAATRAPGVLQMSPLGEVR
jgi:protease-4